MLSRIQENYTSLKRHVNRAFTRPYLPQDMPDWILDSHEIAYRLKNDFGVEFIAMIREAVRLRSEIGCFICLDPKTEQIQLGPKYTGGPYHVVIKDCVGYQHLGAFHVHLGTEEPEFSPIDVAEGLSEFVMAVGGEALDSQLNYSLGVISPFNYWKLSTFEKNRIDDNLETATRLILEMNFLSRTQPPEWREMYDEFGRRAHTHMDNVFRSLGIVYLNLG